MVHWAAGLTIRPFVVIELERVESRVSAPNRPRLVLAVFPALFTYNLDEGGRDTGSLPMAPRNIMPTQIENAKRNQAGYTSVACGWAGALMEVIGAGRVWPEISKTPK